MNFTDRVCSFCGSPFKARKDKLGKYCSVKCSNESKIGIPRPDLSGAANPNWKNGIAKNNYHYKLLQIKRYPARVKARGVAVEAVRQGKISPRPCEICGGEPAQKHHEDYSKPLEITWLCPKHHREMHMSREVA
jgi:hypothetical protein